MYDAREEKTSGEPLRRKRQSAALAGGGRRRESSCHRGPVQPLQSNFTANYYILVESWNPPKYESEVFLKSIFINFKHNFALKIQASSCCQSSPAPAARQLQKGRNRIGTLPFPPLLLRLFVSRWRTTGTPWSCQSRGGCGCEANYTLASQPPESPYTRRNIVIFWGAKTQVCANFGAIGAIAPKCANSAHASTHARKLRKKTYSFFYIKY